MTHSVSAIAAHVVGGDTLSPVSTLIFFEPITHFHPVFDNTPWQPGSLQDLPMDPDYSCSFEYPFMKKHGKHG
jgi:hypothetical protein